MKSPVNIAAALLSVKASVVGHDHEGVAFSVQLPGRERFFCVIASWGEGWDHVSVHMKHYVTKAKSIPTWEEMHWIKEMLFEAEECVVQFHPPASQYVNINPHVLHLWRQHGVPYTLPPRNLV